MIVRNLADADRSDRRIDSNGWTSVRMLLKDDAMGFSFHITTIHAGAELRMHYKNHVECVYCISGTGSIENVATGERHPVQPGVMYALDQHDLHILRADPGVEIVTACVFNPPLTGREVHGEDGAYPLEADQAALDAASKAA